MERRARRILLLVILLLVGAIVVPLSKAQVGLFSKGALPLRKGILSPAPGFPAAAPRGRSVNPAGQEPAQASDVITGASYHNDTSPPLRDLALLPPESGSGEEREANENPKIPSHHADTPDETVQNGPIAAPAAMPGTLLNFDGIPFPGVGCNCAPPDTDGEVGLTQYVQIVNEGYQVFDKTTGASVLGPVGISTIWAGFGGLCQTSGHGDPIVLYDQIANRWLISQFAGTSAQTDECIAVSTSSDATGTYNRYGFHLGTNFFDYPHLAVWPDAYYMSDNVFNSAGTAFLGPQPFAFDRAKMLAGLPATFVSTGITGGSGEDSYHPADLDGSALPPAGAPGTFVEFPGSGAYKVFHFHADFAVPSNSTFTLFASPAAAGFTLLCPTTRVCVPALGGTAVDGIGDRLMHRLAYRNFGGFESVVGNFTVSSGGVAGIRWFELRNVTAGPVTVFQESTYQPDTTWRWMGSVSQDRQGNLALGFSASSAAINPQIRYAGRLATDSPGTLAQGEAHLFDGTGSQTATSSRWGDYSAMSIDPVDDCTFWYTQEYYATTGSFNWRTRVGSFRFAQCGAGTPTPTPTASNTPTRTPVTPTNTPTNTRTATPTRTPTNTRTVTPTRTATKTPTNTRTVTPTITRTNTRTNTPTSTPTSTPTNTPATPTNTPTVTPSVTPTDTPTATPTSVSITDTPTPSVTPTPTPTATPGVSGIAFVKNVGTASHGTGFFTSLQVTVPAAGVAAGNSVVISIYASSNTVTFACTDSASNAYIQDVAAGGGGLPRSAVVSAHNLAALVSGDTITCTFPSSSTTSAMSVNEFSGLSPAPLDGTASGAGTSSAVNSGLTLSTAQSNELVFGFVHSASFTPATSGSNPVEVYADPPNSDPYHPAGPIGTVWPVYRIVSTMRQYQANGTGGGTGGWRAMIATYKGF